MQRIQFSQTNRTFNSVTNGFSVVIKPDIVLTISAIDVFAMIQKIIHKEMSLEKIPDESVVKAEKSIIIE